MTLEEDMKKAEEDMKKAGKALIEGFPPELQDFLRNKEGMTGSEVLKQMFEEEDDEAAYDEHDKEHNPDKKPGLSP